MGHINLYPLKYLYSESCYCHFSVERNASEFFFLFLLSGIYLHISTGYNYFWEKDPRTVSPYIKSNVLISHIIYVTDAAVVEKLRGFKGDKGDYGEKVS